MATLLDRKAHGRAWWYRDRVATHRTVTVSNAQWFEDQFPVDERFGKEGCGRINKCCLRGYAWGDEYPSTAIGNQLAQC